jgi:diaminohydroxyphosphoribosylaminopyrimidine deaminase / 5-amino-6-(5-phosphoribosylamino)uracil reductase
MKESGRRAARDLAEAEARAWHALLDWRHGRAPAGLAAARPAARGAAALFALYGPLLETAHGTVAHLAQSLDGRIACAGGASRWLSGEEDLLHTHRMRALCDAVLVGARTVLHDDPQLTVRRCAGANPVRVVIDPDRRLGPHHRVFRDCAAATLLIVAADRGRSGERFGAAELVALPRAAAGIDPRAIRAALAARGFHRLFIEGGGITISRFLAARALDRLQLTVAPVLLGSGRPSLTLPEIAEPASGLRPRMRRVALGADLMFECEFDA